MLASRMYNGSGTRCHIRPDLVKNVYLFFFEVFQETIAERFQIWREAGRLTGTHRTMGLGRFTLGSRRILLFSIHTYIRVVHLVVCPRRRSTLSLLLGNSYACVHAAVSRCAIPSTPPARSLPSQHALTAQASDYRSKAMKEYLPTFARPVLLFRYSTGVQSASER